jgi:hypothetical protein
LRPSIPSGLPNVLRNGRTVQSATATILINSEIGKVRIITARTSNARFRWLIKSKLMPGANSASACASMAAGSLRMPDGFEEKHIIMDKDLG